MADAKKRVRITIAIEYDLDPKHYDGCTTPEEMLALDMNGLNNDGSQVVELVANSEFELKGEVL